MSKIKGRRKLIGVEFDDAVDERRFKRMDKIDRMTPEQRALVHEYGYHVVETCISLGLVLPRHIKHIVETVLDEFSPTRGTRSSQGIPTAFGIKRSPEGDG